MTDYPCPACGFVVFDEPPGSYVICDVCDWEDDHVQLMHPTMRGGANSESLVEAQQRALSLVPLEVRSHGDLVREPGWRPLQSVVLALDVPEPPHDGIEYFSAAAGDSPTYYWMVTNLTTVESILADIDARAPGKVELNLWIPEQLSFKHQPVAQDVALTIILDHLLAYGLLPDGFEQHTGGRVYRYKSTG